MHAARRLAFVLFCALLPFVVSSGAWAVPIPGPGPAPRASRFAIRNLNVSVRPFSGSRCVFALPDVNIDLLPASHRLILNSPFPCADNTRVVVELSLDTSSSKDSGGHPAQVSLSGSMKLFRLLGGSWVLQQQEEVGRGFIPPTSATTDFFLVSSGVAAGQYNYRITISDL